MSKSIVPKKAETFLLPSQQGFPKITIVMDCIEKIRTIAQCLSDFEAHNYPKYSLYHLEMLIRDLTEIALTELEDLQAKAEKIEGVEAMKNFLKKFKDF